MSRVFCPPPIPLLILLLFIAASLVTRAAQLTYDTLQQSAEFGMPEATAKFAAKPGFLDIAGVKLGMSVKEVVAAVKAHNANFKLEPQAKLEFEALILMPYIGIRG